MTVDAHALVIGGGPAGASAAILLANAGWRVVLAEQHAYPRQKVCGECIAAGNLPLLDELGVGLDFRRMAGTSLREVGWMSAGATIVGQLPRAVGRDGFGKALGRDKLDSLLLERARALGVCVLQPATVRSVVGNIGRFECYIETRRRSVDGPMRDPTPPMLISARVVIDAHGSWEAGPSFGDRSADSSRREVQRASDLFAFKASFQGSGLTPGLLPVLAFNGGYGGMVVAESGRTTLACCIRRDVLKSSRAFEPQPTAGLAVEAMLRRSCRDLSDVLRNTQREGPWLAVGPIRPGIRLQAPRSGVFRIGNAAGESHPLIGEGISMALQSSAMLVGLLTVESIGALDAHRASLLQRRYAIAWQNAFASRVRLAALYAHVAMRPTLAFSVGALFRRWPALLTGAARLAGKARHSINPLLLSGESV